MKRNGILLKWSLMFLVCLGTIAAAGSEAGAKNRCKERCDDIYRTRKNVCKAIPIKYERHRCEDSAKRAKNDCRHRCR